VSERLAELAVAYKNRGVLGFDLAGAETDYPARDHSAAFGRIIKNNINSTVHAGEAWGPDSIAQAIQDCGAHRIGHGTRLKEDGNLLNFVCDHRIPLEVCLTSNVQTGAASSFETHPLKFYFDYGLRVTVNTDNRLMSATTCTRELERTMSYLQFSISDIANIILNGFKSAFLPYHARKALLKEAIFELGSLLGETHKKSYHFSWIAE